MWTISEPMYVWWPGGGCRPSESESPSYMYRAAESQRSIRDIPAQGLHLSHQVGSHLSPKNLDLHYKKLIMSGTYFQSLVFEMKTFMYVHKNLVSSDFKYEILD